MVIFIVALLISILLCTFLLWYTTTYNKFQGYIIKMNEAEANIDASLRKRFDLLNKSIGIIKANLDSDEEVMETIIKLRSRKLSNFDLDRQLYQGINEFHEYAEKMPQLRESAEFLKIELSLAESETEMFAFRKYYNDKITEFNKMVRSFPSNMVAKLCHYKERTYFDGKDMNDDIINDFKL